MNKQRNSCESWSKPKTKNSHSMSTLKVILSVCSKNVVISFWRLRNKKFSYMATAFLQSWSKQFRFCFRRTQLFHQIELWDVENLTKTIQNPYQCNCQLPAPEYLHLVHPRSSIWRFWNWKTVVTWYEPHCWRCIRAIDWILSFVRETRHTSQIRII